MNDKNYILEKLSSILTSQRENNFNDIKELEKVKKEELNKYKKLNDNYFNLQEEFVKTKEGSDEEKEFLKKYKKDLDKRYMDLFKYKYILGKKYGDVD